MTKPSSEKLIFFSSSIVVQDYNKILHIKAFLDLFKLKEGCFLKQEFTNTDLARWVAGDLKLHNEVYGFSPEYMKEYRNGNWSNFIKGYVNPAHILQNMADGELVISDPSKDGFLKDLDNKIIPRKINFECWESSYSDIVSLEHELRSINNISDIKLEQVCDTYVLHAKYNANQEEITDWLEKFFFVSNTHGPIHDLPAIKKYLNKK